MENHFKKLAQPRTESTDFVGFQTKCILLVKYVHCTLEANIPTKLFIKPCSWITMH